MHSGEFRMLDLNSLQVEKTANIIAETATNSTQKPQLALTERFVYITSPTTGELLQVSLSTLAVKKTKTSATPYAITIIGHENSAGH